MPSAFVLEQNYPNPFNPTTIIEYNLPKDTRVKIVIFDLLGRVIKTLVDQEKSTGTYKIKFDASDLSSGVYFYQLQTREFSQTKKLILMR
ncbi:MAG: T9SS type A sorting domain-containing protein [Nitrososphaera sp.]